MSTVLRPWLERVFTRAWSRRAPWLMLLLPLELIYRSIVWLRRTLFFAGFLQRYRAPVPVVVIGNISVGGNGKTPVVIALVDALMAQGIRPGVISRGHGRSARHVGLVKPNSTVSEVGDEALLIHRRTGCPCAVHKSRSVAVRALLEKHRLDIVIADDGLQHYALQRDLEVVMYDAVAAFGNGRCLPVGPLREPLSRLRSADLVLAKGGSSPESVTITADKLINIRTHEQRAATPDALSTELVAIAGIARPEGFFDMLRSAGFNCTALAFPDHHNFTAKDLPAPDGRAIIMTEKDAVKCAHLVGDNAWYLKIEAHLPQKLTDAVLQLLPSNHH